MGWPLRMLVPSEIQFVTARCFQGRLLMRPSPRTNALIGGTLARAARLHHIEVFGFVFASNHFHLLVRAPEGTLPQFMKHLRTNISKKVGWLIGWRGSFWEQRYSAEPVLDDAALEQRVRYILAHGVKEGLVRRSQDWPGLSSLWMMLDGAPAQFQWFEWSQRWRNRQATEARDRLSRRWSIRESLALAPLPRWTNASLEVRRRLALGWIRDINREGLATFRRVLGVAGVLAQNPLKKVDRPTPRPRPTCHTTFRDLKYVFLDKLRSFVTAFRLASERWRHGDLSVEFPPWAFRPFLKPREARESGALAVASAALLG